MRPQNPLLILYRDDLLEALGRGSGKTYKAMSRALTNYGEGYLDAPDEMVMVWSDLHIGHANIIRYCDRPFHNVGQMDVALWTNWQLGVAPYETLVCVGDVSFRSQADRIANQHGDTKILVIGNHDLHYDGTLRTEGFDQVKALLIAEGDPPLVFTHVPLPNVPSGYINIHGHRHEKLNLPDSPHINVSVEQLEYRPIALTRLRRLAQAILTGNGPEGDTTLVRIRKIEE